MTEKFNVGTFAFSKAGHDKRHTYIIVGTDASYVYLADGINKLVEKPKKKNKKHIQITHIMDNQIETKFSQNQILTDEDVKEAIARYKANVSEVEEG